jgi:predicted nucleic acid-binding protein
MKKMSKPTFQGHAFVENAAVARRLSNRTIARKISGEILESYEIVDKSLIFDTAWMIALNTGCSGFDSYFIALAKIKNATLVTDDSAMHYHAMDINAD